MMAGIGKNSYEAVIRCIGSCMLRCSRSIIHSYSESVKAHLFKRRQIEMR